MKYIAQEYLNKNDWFCKDEAITESTLQSQLV